MKSFPKLQEAEGRLEAKQEELAEIFNAAGPEMDMSKVEGFDDTQQVVDHIRNLNEELNDLGEEVEGLRSVANAAERVDNFDVASGAGENGAPKQDDRPKSFGELFVEAKAHQVKGREFELDYNPTNAINRPRATLFETGTGWAPETTRGPRIVLDEQRPIEVVDLIPQTTTTQTAVTYMEETTFTNNAAETAEGASKPEAALALTERSSTVRKIAVWLPVTDEQLEDVPRVTAYLNNRLPFMVRQRLDGQILTGNGTAPNLTGILNVSGIQTQAKGTDPTPDAIYKAMTLVRSTGRAEPDGVVLHPNDWQSIRLLRTSDGVYIWGSPAEQGPARIWGLPVAQTTALTENTGLVGAFNPYSELAVKSGITVETSNSHSTYFVENKQAVRAEMRAAFIVYRPTAFATVTGI